MFFLVANLIFFRIAPPSMSPSPLPCGSRGNCSVFSSGDPDSMALEYCLTFLPLILAHVETASGCVWGERVNMASGTGEAWDLGYINTSLCSVIHLPWPLWWQPLSLDIWAGAVEHPNSGGDPHSVLRLRNLPRTYSLLTGRDEGCKQWSSGKNQQSPANIPMGRRLKEWLKSNTVNKVTHASATRWEKT